MNAFREPSTYAGLAALAQLVGNFLPPSLAWVAYVITAAAGSAAVALRENRP